MPIELRRFEAVWKLLGSRIDDVCLSFGPLVRAALTKDFCRLHQHLPKSGTYAYIIVQTSGGPRPFALTTAVNPHNSTGRIVWRLIAMPLPPMSGDSSANCPGRRRSWYEQQNSPFWHHVAVGSTCVRPAGWRGTDYPFISLARSFRHWPSLARLWQLRTVCPLRPVPARDPWLALNGGPFLPLNSILIPAASAISTTLMAANI